MPLRMESYRFWARTVKDRQDILPIHFPTSSEEWLRGKICPLCDGSQQVRPEGGEPIYCLCSTLRWLEKWQERYFQYELPIRSASLDDLEELQVPPRSYDPEQKKRYDRANKELSTLVEFVSGWMEEPSEWMFISGPNGVGKTHILRSIKTALPSVAFYISAAHFQSLSFNALSNGTHEEFVQFMATVPILLLDDWGLEHKADMTTDALAAVIDRRYSFPQEFPTIITTNYTKLGAGTDIAIRRIASRMMDQEFSRIFTLSQVDYRLPSVLRQ